MKCWICNENEATTGEHLIKASDLRATFGSISPDNPIFFHTDERRNQKIKGMRAKRLKSRGLICEYCNSTRTQPFDKAWETISEYLRQRKPRIRQGELLRFDRVFPDTIDQSMLNVHLYFVKVFGCEIVGNDVPIDVRSFAHALMSAEAHPAFYLALCPPLAPKGRRLGASPIQTMNQGGRARVAWRLHSFEHVTVRALYCEYGHSVGYLSTSWHPSKRTKRLRIHSVT